MKLIPTQIAIVSTDSQIHELPKFVDVAVKVKFADMTMEIRFVGHGDFTTFQRVDGTIDADKLADALMHAEIETGRPVSEIR